MSPRGRRFGIALALVMLCVSVYYSAREAVRWPGRVDSWKEFDAFAAELRAAIPPDARVRVVVPGDSGLGLLAERLNVQLHPRRLVVEGPADWVIELPAEKFDRSASSYRRLSP